MKRIIKLFVISFLLSQALEAQTGKKRITVIADTVATPAYKNTQIILFQKGQSIRSELFQSILVDEGVETDIDFANSAVFISGIKKLKIYKDTIIDLHVSLLADVVVKGKKRMVSETLTGFNYYPQNDSLFREKSILLALQRLPFVNVPDGHSLPTYKGSDQKILFLIDGKPRYGLEGGWVDVLHAIKAKDIFRVELIEEIPIKYRNQGFQIVIDIQTIDANIHGESFNLAATYDQRKNLNPQVRGTLLRKKTDFSLNASIIGDNLRGRQNAIVYKGGEIISQQNNLNNSTEESRRIGLDYGNRIDSFNDVGLNFLYNKFIYRNTYTNTFSFPSRQNNISNSSERDYYNVNFSWISRQKKGITKSLAFVGNIYQDAANNRFAFLIPKFYDSINMMSKLNRFHWILEYNIQNNKDPNFLKEMGIQVYNKWVIQDYDEYDLNPASNSNGNLLYSSQDTLRNNQMSIRPYYRFGKNFSPTKRLALTLSPELFTIRNNDASAKFLLLPQIRANFRKLLPNGLSIRNILEFGFEKPNEDYLALTQLVTDPGQQKRGSSNLIPAKYINESIELVRRKKSLISFMLTYRFSFDDINYFRFYDTTATGKLISLANNGGFSHVIGPTIFYQMPATKKISFWLSVTCLYSSIRNKEFHTKYKGFYFSGSHSLNYEINPKIGNLSFSSFLNGNNNGSQGYFQGSMKYMFSYSTRVYKNRLAISVLAQNFLRKNRNVNTYSFNEQYESHTNVISPYRLLSLRLAYNFSNIKLAKFAAKKNTEISGEKAVAN